jgi:hypothetical protein
MKTEDIIAGMCLYGFIRKESPAEQARCLGQIRRHYGTPVATIVEGFIRKDKRAAAG